MKLEHLIQTYNFNRIPARIDKEINQDGEKAGVIKLFNGITASYLLDEEDIVIAIKLFINCLTEDKKTITNQIDHVVKIINVIQKTIELLGNIPQKEANLILEGLGMFNNSFKEGKRIRHIDHVYSVEVVNGLLCFTITEEVVNEQN